MGEFILGVVGPYPEGSPQQFEVRAFALPIGVREDPVCGSVNAGIAQWLIDSGQAPPSYEASQGTAIGRDGILTNATGVEIGFGFHTMIGALSLFNISLVLLLVRARLSGMDRTHVEASYDLYATPWRTFWQVTFPQLLPAIVAGFLLSFTFAFDDYLISTFVNGRGTSTLPLYVFGQIRVGVTPSTNAIASVMLLITLGILLVGQVVLTRNARRSGGDGKIGGVAGMVAENTST